MPKSKTNKQRIEELEAEVSALRTLLSILQERVAAIAARPDPWRPIGPRPNTPNPWNDHAEPKPYVFWPITCDTDDSRQG